MTLFNTMLDFQVQQIELQKIKKRVHQSKREFEMIETAEDASFLIEKTSRAISDWHSESDWPLHIDQAKRSVEAIAEILNREGYKEAASYLRMNIWKEPKPRKKTANV